MSGYAIYSVGTPYIAYLPERTLYNQIMIQGPLWIDVEMTRVIITWPEWLRESMYVLSFIGQPACMITLLAGAGLCALIRRNYVWVAAMVAAGFVIVLNTLLKVLFHRVRPDTYDPHAALLPTYSFPSGHAAASAVVLALVAYMAWRFLPRVWGVAVAIVSGMLIVGIGISRVYLGFHYPTDVLAGWIVGLIGALIIVWQVRRHE